MSKGICTVLVQIIKCLLQVAASGSDYKPTEHGGTKKDGSPDKRTSSDHGFGGDTERASQEGQKGGSTQPDEIYKPKEHGGKKEDGGQDSRTSSDHGFGSDRERASEAGKVGGSK